MLNLILAEDLRRWGKTEKEQEYPHRPRDFLAAFPEEAHQQLLVNNVWWWRYAVNPEKCSRVFPPLTEGSAWWPTFMHKIFMDHLEPSAFFYEFRARYKKRYVWDFGRPWILCSDEQRRSLSCLLPSNYPSTLNLHLPRPEDRWSAFFGDYNLLLNDETLIRQFTKELKQKRSDLGLSRPAPGQGVRRRSISWQPIEYMDIRRYGIRVLNESERSALSRARKLYEETCARLRLDP